MDDNIDASNDPEPIMVGDEDAVDNPACQAILANEVGLAAADYHDDKLRKGYCPSPADSSIFGNPSVIARPWKGSHRLRKLPRTEYVLKGFLCRSLSYPGCRKPNGF